MMALLAQASTTGNDVFLLWGCILFGVALVLLIIEFLVPSGGLIGILTGIAAVGSITAFFRYDQTWGIAVTLGYIVLTPIVLLFLFKFWINSPLAGQMILGGRAAIDPEQSEREERQRWAQREALKALIGVEGKTETALRPVGTVRINGQRVDGLAEHGIIEADTRVVVTEIYDNQIKVRPL